jgi:hypothetical protein
MTALSGLGVGLGEEARCHLLAGLLAARRHRPRLLGKEVYASSGPAAVLPLSIGLLGEEEPSGRAAVGKEGRGDG